MHVCMLVFSSLTSLNNTTICICSISMTFPKVIHIVWFQGAANISRPAFSTNVENWQVLNPDWKVNFLDDTALKAQCGLYSPAALQVYNAFRTMHQKIDFGRYVTLYNIGGIYVDMDAYAFRPLTYNERIRLLISNFELSGKPVLGLSSTSASSIEAYVLSKGASTTFINNAVMMGSPQNPDLKRFIDQIIATAVANPAVGLQDSTGPLKFGEFFQSLMSQHHSQGDIVRFSANVFEPCSHDGACHINDDTVALHQYEMSWLSGYMRKIAKFYAGHSKLIWAIATVAALMYIFRVQVSFAPSTPIHLS